MNFLKLILLLACAGARAAPLTVLVDTGTEMPLARIEHGTLVEGIHKDLGTALAAQLDRPVRFLVLPRKRVTQALATGQADVMCLYVPEWLPGPFDWTRPFFPYAEVVVTTRRVARPARLADLADQRLGTVLGYRHPEIEEVLGARFRREDGPSTETNLHKMMAGRLDHVIASNLYIDYRRHHGSPALAIHEPLVVKAMRLQCAVSRAGAVAVADLNRAVAQLVRDDALGHIARASAR